MAHLLVRFARAAQAGAAARDGIDLALAALAYEHHVSVLFEGDGVGLLACANATAELAWTRGFAALSLHGVARVGVDAEALARRGLAERPLQLPAEALDAQARRAWIEEADAVFAF